WHCSPDLSGNACPLSLTGRITCGRICRNKKFASITWAETMMGIRVFVRRTIFIVYLCALIGVSFCALAAQTNAPAPSPALQAALAEAEKGAAAAQFRLGMMFLNGKEVPRDLEMAAHWLQKAAEQNHAAAQFNLAVLYTQGAGVPQNYPEAAKWFQRAADQNDPASQYNL